MKVFNYSDSTQYVTCQPDADHHCLTCSDEVVAARVVYVEPGIGIAFVEVSNRTEKVSSHADEQRGLFTRFIREEVDITLVEDVTPGDLLLVQGGVAIAHLEEGGEVDVN